MVHVGRPPIDTSVFKVTAPALPDRGVERGGRLPEQGFARRVASDALRGLRTAASRVAGGAIRLKERVSLGKSSGARLSLPSVHRSPARQAALG